MDTPDAQMERAHWRDFEQSKVFMLINRILRRTGWVLVINYNEDLVAVDVYPARLTDVPLATENFLSSGERWIEKHVRHPHHG